MLARTKRSLAAVGLLAQAAFAAGQITTTPLTFAGVTTVGAASAPVTVTLTATTGGVLTSLAALTVGSPNLDYAVTPLTCAVNMTLSGGESCTVSVVFSPQYPGVRQGAVVALSGNQLLASAPLTGVGQGSLPVLVPGTINTVAGDGDWIYQRDGIPATEAPVFLPSGLGVDAAGDLFFCDTSNNRVRRVDASSGLISTVAGNGSPGGAGDGGQATQAELNNPSGLVIDGAGDLYIADTGNNVVRRVDAFSGLITTFAGEMGSTGYAGDGGPAASALLASPRGLALMPGGDLLITDSANNAVRLVNIVSGQIQTIAGTGAAGYNGDGIAANTAQLNDPYGVAARSDGAIAIADLENQRIRLVTLAGIISTAAGTGQRNAGTPTAQQLDGPADVAFDPAGDLFIADAGNDRVRVIFAGVIQTLVGSGSEQFTGDGGPANQAGIYGPYSLFIDAGGNLWLTDTFHNRIREVTGSLLSLTYATIKVGNVSPPQVGSLYNEGNANLLLNAPVFNQAALDAGTTTCNPSAMAPSASCNMGVEFAPTTVGTNVLGSISWPSNAPNVTPMDGLSGQVLSVNVTAVALASSANPGVVAQPVTLTATVTSSEPGQTGTVTFSEGSSVWCAAVTLGGGGTASCLIPGLSLGSHTLTAAYSGDTNNAASTSPAYIEVVKQQPALVFSVSSNPTVVTTNLTLQLTTVDQTGTATGDVVFYDGATALGSVALDGTGVARLNISTLSIGFHTLIAQYAGDGANVSGTSNSISEQITLASTTTLQGTSATDVTVGTPVHFTATVTSTSGPPITGTVTFKDGTTVIGSATLVSGTGSLTVSTLAPGTHNITAVYSGDANNGASTSAATTVIVSQIGTVTTLSASVNPLSAGATLQLTANVAMVSGATADGLLTGSVTFNDGATVLGTVAINTSGQATLAVSTLSVGSHSLVASFTGSTNYAVSSSTAINETVQQTATQTTLSSAAGSLAGRPATFTAQVTSSTGVPAGQVNFFDGSTLLGTATLSGTGSAAVTTSTLSVGTHSITASYTGNSNYTASTSAAQQFVVQLAQPTLTLSGPASPINAGTSAGFSAVLASPGVSPTGTLLLLDSGAPIATAAVSAGGSFPFSISTLSIGTHLLTASYSGDAYNSAVASASVMVVVQQASSSTLLVASVNPLIVGSPLTLTATVTSVSPNASGLVRFFDGSTLLGTSTLAGTGSASFAPTGLTLGSHTLTAVYSGDTNHGGSTSSPATESVVQSTTTTLTSSNNPATHGQTVTFTVQVTGMGTGPGAWIPAGSVSFHDGGTVLATATLNSLGGASLSTSSLAAGSHTITVTYAGDAEDAGGSSPALTEVIQQQPSLVLTVSPNPAIAGTNVTLTLTATDQSGTPTGSVILYDGATALATVALNGAGVAQWNMQAFSAGAHSLSAQYAGDSANTSGTSNTVIEQINQANTTAALAANVNNTAYGSPVVFTATVANLGGPPMTGSVTFRDGANLLGTAVVSNGASALTVTTLTAGSHNITAAYGGDLNDVASTSPALLQTVVQAATQTILSSTPSSSLAGTPATFNVVVSSANGVPTGQVSFRDGSTVLALIALSTADTATFSSTSLAQGTHSVTATYLGDSNYNGSVSAPDQYAVQLAQPAVTLSGPAAPVDAGTTASFTAALTSPGVAPTGTLTLLDGSSPIATASVSGAGTLVFSTSLLTVGSHALTASYAGDANNHAATSPIVTVTVRQANTATVLATSSNPITLGSALTLTATVTSDSPNPSGAVQFYDGATLLAPGALGTNGIASLSTIGLALGPHTITAVYAGDTNHAGSTSAATVEMVVGTTSGTVTSNNNPAASGQMVVFTARVMGTGKAVPTGTVTFRQNGTVLSTVGLDGSASASLSTSTLAVGTQTITTTYAGDQNYAGNVAQVVETITDAYTTASLTGSTTLATFGQPVSLTATVSSNGGMATGTVTFTEGGTAIGTALLNSSGVAVLTLSTLGPGAHTLIANYAGDGKAEACVSAPVELSVKQATAVALSSSNNPSLTLSSISFTAAVTNIGAGPATGSVQFTDAGSAIGSAALDTTGRATLTLPGMSAILHPIVATYTGDSENLAGTSSVFGETVQLRPSTTTVTGSASSYGQENLFAVVQGQGPVGPGGSVTFTSAGVTLGQATLGANGVATLAAAMTQPTLVVTASYSGDANYAVSQSPATSISAAPVAPFSLSANPPAITVVTDQHTSVSISIGSINGFADTIALGCVGLPKSGTCTFTPSQVTLTANGTASASVVVDTGNPLGAGATTTASLGHGSGTFLCCLPLGLLAGWLRRRKLAIFFVLAVAVAVTLSASGCSGLNTNSTPPGSYTFKIVGTGQHSGISEFQTVTLVVTQ